ncbi:aldehyde dehydrogenase family protein [Streptomyces chartreusis]|uniref:aldehyde dehydrogenase family protein n=1 Tax=Streptomyces chartreusis TaxID=1969 RepID=UPI00364538DB
MEGETARPAAIITAEKDKVLDDARSVTVRRLEVGEFARCIPQQPKGGLSENAVRTVDSVSLRQRLGVAASILPSNFPAMEPMCAFPLAFAQGNAFMMMPSEIDPPTASNSPDWSSWPDCPGAV